MEKAPNAAPGTTQTASETRSTPEKETYSRAQRLLLLFCFALGVAFDIGWRYAERMWLYGAFWLLAMGVYVAFGGKRVLADKTARALAAPAAFLCVWYMLDYAAPLRAYNLFMIPLLMLLFAVTGTRAIPIGREGVIARDCLRGVFVLPFAGLRHFFCAVGSLFSSGKRGAARRVGAGLAIGVPLALVVLSLLVSADDMMGRVLDSVFGSINMAAGIGHILRTAVCMALLFGFIFSMLWKREAALPEKRAAPWPASTMLVALWLLLAVYALFAYVQFKYLFGGQLPAELTYSAYARKGFAELLLVACINFTLYGLCVRYCVPTRGLFAALAALLAATVLLLASACMRLLLYIGAYGLTFNRIVPLWLMAYLSALVILCAARLWKTKMPLLRIATFSFIYWYILLNLPDWGGIILSWNNTL